MRDNLLLLVELWLALKVIGLILLLIQLDLVTDKYISMSYPYPYIYCVKQKNIFGSLW